MAYTKKHDYVNTSAGHPIRKGTTKYKVLEFIHAGRAKGVRYLDVVKFIVEDIKGFEYHQGMRGYWATNLLHGKWRPGGYVKNSNGPIMYTYCKKLGEPGKKGNWVLNDDLLDAHFSKSGISISKRLDILRRARYVLSMPNLEL